MKVDTQPRHLTIVVRQLSPVKAIVTMRGQRVSQLVGLNCEQRVRAAAAFGQQVDIAGAL